MACPDIEEVPWNSQVRVGDSTEIMTCVILIKKLKPRIFLLASLSTAVFGVTLKLESVDEVQKQEKSIHVIDRAARMSLKSGREAVL